MPTREELEFHYRLERELADRIKGAAREDRARVSLEAYDELFRKVPWHPGHLNTPELRARLARSYDGFFRIIGEGRDVLEIGCGNGAQLRVLAGRNRRCVGIDISSEIVDRQVDLPPNVELHMADASDLSLFTDDSFDAAFSKQLLEHLHPDDIDMHFREVARVLRPGGFYVFETPNRLDGPHDVSRHFDEVSTCFHLKEYTNGELLRLMKSAGFRRFRSPLFRQRLYEVLGPAAKLTEVPTSWKVCGEALAGGLPRRARAAASRRLRLNIFMQAWV